MNEKEIIDQLKLSMSILSGRRPADSIEPNTPDAALLRLTAPITAGDVLIASEDVLCELIAYALGMSEKANAAPPPDPKLLAVALIEEIKGAGGTLPRSRVHLPPDFLIALAEDFIIRIDGSNLVLGRNAERALRDMEQK